MSQEEIALPIKRPRDSKKLLSFIEEEEEDEEIKAPKRHFGKNPEVETNFISDIERQVIEKQQREVLAEQYEEEQKKIKEELIELSFSFWDGTNNKYTLKTTKETSISHFLELAVEILKKDFPEIRQLHSSAFIYVKEDIIIPYDYTFYDLIINDAKGRNGNLFNLTKKQDYDKDEGNVAKILERKWYEKNKHIFPANRWEIYDPLKNN